MKTLRNRAEALSGHDKPQEPGRVPSRREDVDKACSSEGALQTQAEVQ